MMMVHLGEAPPIIEDVLNLMDDGDVLTHGWKGVYEFAVTDAEHKREIATRKLVVDYTIRAGAFFQEN